MFGPLAADLNDMLRHYIRANVIFAVLSLVYCSAAMLFLRYPHATALRLLAGVARIYSRGRLDHGAGHYRDGWTSRTTPTGSGWHCCWPLADDHGHTESPRESWDTNWRSHPLLAIFTVMVRKERLGGIAGIYLSGPSSPSSRV